SVSFFCRSKRATSGRSAMRAPPKMHAKIVKAACVDNGCALWVPTNQAAPTSTASVRKKIHIGSFGFGSEEFMGNSPHSAAAQGSGGAADESFCGDTSQGSRFLRRP